jgi:hypothetical protein
MILLALFVVSCTATGPAKDSDDIEQEDVLNFGKLRFWKKKEQPKENVTLSSSTQSTNTNTSPSRNIPVDNTIPSNLHDYDLYQLWLQDRQTNSENYQEFKEYQEYKNWLKLKRREGQ